MMGEQFVGERFEKQNWVELLLFIYSREEKWEYFSKGEPPVIESDHPLVERTSLKASQIDPSLAFLEKNDLIEETNTGTYELTSKGFDVAHGREIKEKELRNTRMVTLLTIVLAISAAGQLVMELQSLTPSFVQLLIPSILLMIAGYAFGKLDLL